MHTVRNAALRAQSRRALALLAVFGADRSGPRHPLVAALMVLPPAALLTVAFGGWDAIVLQASSVVGLLGH